MTAATQTKTETETREFETETCSRCAGSGSFSYCQMYGSTCFKCHGKTKVYTKKGLAAIAYFHSLNPTVRMDQVKIGNRVNIDGYGKFNVLEITPAGASTGTSNGVTTTYEMLNIKGKTMSYTAEISHHVKLVLAPAVHNANRTAALGYQETLTKAGTPRKRGA